MTELLTTDTVAPADRVDYWRDVICAVYVELGVEAIDREGFGGSVALTAWGETKISHVASMGQVVTRRPRAAENDCLVSLQMTGVGRVTQAGRTAVLNPGDFALYDATRPYELAFDRPFDQLVLQFPRPALVARNVDIESAVARSCSGSHGVGAVATSFLRTLSAHDSEIPDDHRRRLGDQAVDVTATALATVAGALPTGQSVRQFNRQRILDFVQGNLRDPELSVGQVARSFGVSTRTIQKLFADDGVPLGTRIREARIERARQALVDPRRSHLTIAWIAHDLGFRSPAQFSRAFRAACGCTPREYRQRHRR